MMIIDNTGGTVDSYQRTEKEMMIACLTKSKTGSNHNWKPDRNEGQNYGELLISSEFSSFILKIAGFNSKNTNFGCLLAEKFQFQLL